MAETTKISWCDSTWNWVRGCERVSEGCANCYITSTTPFRTSGQKHGDPRVVAKDATFNAPLAWNKKPWVCDMCGTFCTVGNGESLVACPTCRCTCYAHRRRVFSLSLGDWLDPKIPVPVLARALDIIRRCEDLDFLLCTKRPELFPDRMSDAFFAAGNDHTLGHSTATFIRDWWYQKRPPENVWILASAENQKRLGERVPHLLRIPAVVHGLSCEPLLGSTSLGRWIGHTQFTREWKEANSVQTIDWVIVGGESGSKARPCNVEWIRSVKDQCQAAGVPVFVKQLGSNCATMEALADNWPNGTRTRQEVVAGVPQYPERVVLKHSKGGDPSEWPEDLRVQQFPDVKP